MSDCWVLRNVLETKGRTRVKDSKTNVIPRRPSGVPLNSKWMQFVARVAVLKSVKREKTLP